MNNYNEGFCFNTDFNYCEQEHCQCPTPPIPPIPPTPPILPSCAMGPTGPTGPTGATGLSGDFTENAVPDPITGDADTFLRLNNQKQYKLSKVAGLNNGNMPESCGFQAWTFDPILVENQISIESGSIYLTKIVLENITTISEVSFGVGVVSADYTNGANFIGMYDSFGNLMSLTDDISALIETPDVQPVRTAPLFTPITAGKDLEQSYVYIALLLNADQPVTSTIRAIQRQLYPRKNQAITPNAAKFGQLLTSLPSTIPLDLIEEDPNIIWFGI